MLSLWRREFLACAWRMSCRDSVHQQMNAATFLTRDMPSQESMIGGLQLQTPAKTTKCPQVVVVGRAPGPPMVASYPAHQVPSKKERTALETFQKDRRHPSPRLQ